MSKNIFEPTRRQSITWFGAAKRNSSAYCWKRLYKNQFRRPATSAAKPGRAADSYHPLSRAQRSMCLIYSKTATIECYRRRESSVEEAPTEMYLAGVSVRCSIQAGKHSIPLYWSCQ